MPNLIGGIVLGYIWKIIFDAFLALGLAAAPAHNATSASGASSS